MSTMTAILGRMATYSGQSVLMGDALDSAAGPQATAPPGCLEG
jgi:hypothetical protein